MHRLRNGQVDLMIISTITTLKPGSTYSLYSQLVNAMIQADITTITDPNASAKT